MKWTEIAAGQTHRAFCTLMNAFGDHADIIVGRINTDEAVAPRVAALCHNNGYELSVSQAKAREIMGKNFFGLEEARNHFGATLSKRQQAYMAEVPYAEEMLVACKDTHVLVAYVPMSIVDTRTKTAGVKLPTGQSLLAKQNWYDNQSAGNAVSALEWHLIRKTPVTDSTSKTWEEQLGLLEKIDEVPEANVLVYTIIGHFLATGERLFEKVYVRTSTLDSGGRRVFVGYFDAEGLDISDWHDGSRGDGFGLSAVRKQ